MKKAMILAAALIVQMVGPAMAQTQKDIKPLTTIDFDAAMRRAEEIPPPPPKPELGPIDKWRYQSCQQDAATAPTHQGVIVRLRICREKFGQ